MVVVGMVADTVVPVGSGKWDTLADIVALADFDKSDKLVVLLDLS